MRKKFLLSPLYMFLGILFSCAEPVDFMVVSSGEENQILNLTNSNGLKHQRFEDLKSAVAQAEIGQGVIVVNSAEDINGVTEELLKSIKEKQLRVFIEFEKNIAGLQFRDSVLPLDKERAVVATSSIQGLNLMDVMSVNNNEMLLLEEDAAPNPLMVMARVAGYDKAEYGLEETEIYPLLFEYGDNMLVATTQLSNAIEGRFGPSQQWRNLYNYIFSWVSGKDIYLEHWEPSLRPSYPKNDQLEENALTESVKKGVDWYYKAKLMVHPSWSDLHEKNTARRGKGVVHPSVADDFLIGNGLNGILEGHSSKINPDGSQPLRWWIRADSQAETAYALSSASVFLENETYKETANNLLKYLFEESNLRSGESNNPDSPSYGLIGWATTDSDVYYGDDNARILLALIGASINLETDQWDEKIIEALVGNYRVAGKNGFRGGWFRDSNMQETTWQELGERDYVNIHPHYESWLWALYIWMYDKTYYQPFLDKAKTAITMTMDAFPNWKWTNGIQQEYSRMVLPLAWLVRVEDTQEHREWLDLVVGKLLEGVNETGAIPERLGESGMGYYEKVASNAEYGTKEAPLISSEKNKVSDLLYTSNFAFFTLNEAAHATGNEAYKEAVSKLADFMIRIQVDSQEHEDLDGAWFRAFDYGKWEYWASNADSDWGPWGTLTGWTQSWIVNGLINESENQSLWERSQEKYSSPDFKQKSLKTMESMLELELTNN